MSPGDYAFVHGGLLISVGVTAFGTFLIIKYDWPNFSKKK